MKPIFKTLFVFFLSVIVSITIFAFFFDAYFWSYDPTWTGLKSILFNLQNNSNEKIFILGNSQVQAINSTFVQNHLLKNDMNYDVYNLADPGAQPSKTLRYLDTIISANPKLVVYGIGMFEFQEKPTFQPPLEFYSNNQLFDPKDTFWYTVSYFTDDNLALGSGSSPKDRIILFLKFIINGGNNQHPFMPLLTTDIKDLSQLTSRDFTNFDLSLENKNIEAVFQIINKLEENDIDVILFTVPNVKPYLTQISDKELEDYESFFKKISIKNDVYFLHDQYQNLNIWRDGAHVAVNKNSTIYSQDIVEILLREI
jgi:hypothetical protein